MIVCYILICTWSKFVWCLPTYKCITMFIPITSTEPKYDCKQPKCCYLSSLITNNSIKQTNRGEKLGVRSAINEDYFKDMKSKWGFNPTSRDTASHDSTTPPKVWWWPSDPWRNAKKHPAMSAARGNWKVKTSDYQWFGMPFAICIHLPMPWLTLSITVLWRTYLTLLCSWSKKWGHGHTSNSPRLHFLSRGQRTGSYQALWEFDPLVLHSLQCWSTQIPRS